MYILYDYLIVRFIIFNHPQISVCSLLVEFSSLLLEHILVIAHF